MKSWICPSMGCLFVVTGVLGFYSGITAKKKNIAEVDKKKVEVKDKKKAQVTDEQKADAVLEKVQNELKNFFDSTAFKAPGKGGKAFYDLRNSLENTLWGHANSVTEVLRKYIETELSGRLSSFLSKPKFGKKAALDKLEDINGMMASVVHLATDYYNFLNSLDVVSENRLRQDVGQLKDKLEGLRTLSGNVYTALNSVAQDVKKSSTQSRKQRFVANVLAAVVDNIRKHLEPMQKMVDDSTSRVETLAKHGEFPSLFSRHAQKVEKSDQA